MIIPRVDLHGDTGAPIARFLGLAGMTMSIVCFLSPLPTVIRVESLLFLESPKFLMLFSGLGRFKATNYSLDDVDVLLTLTMHLI